MCAAHAQKNELKPHLKKYWVIPPEANAAFVCAMEDVLEVYQRDYDPKRPVVCIDETSKQLVGETRVPVPSAPGQPQRIDYEYERKGTANLFMVTEPLVGERHVKVTEQRTAVDFAELIRNMVDDWYAGTGKIVLVMDNLNTHRLASLYEAFEPAEARRLLEKLEIHHTPKHGSWLNIAEIELSILSRQCLHRRIDSARVLKKEVATWERQRNRTCGTVDWQFTTTEARKKLKRLYPSFQK
jgi:hypothetical protein